MSEHIAYHCVECHFPIEDFHGAVCADYEQIRAASIAQRQAVPAFDPEHPQTIGQRMRQRRDLGLLAKVDWLPYHYTCQPAPGYDIDVSELRTPRHAIWWTRHLMPKTWFPRSTWEDILTRALDIERKGA